MWAEYVTIDEECQRDMTSDKRLGTAVATEDVDYGKAYYADYGGDRPGSYDWSDETWRGFHRHVASRLVAALAPKTSLDIGCAKGLLVQALAEAGVDARGFDISDTAIAGAHADVRSRISVASATEPIEGRYDLVTCIEVLEHLEPADAQRAIDSMCAVTDRILFSSTPGHFDDPTHINVRPTADWVTWFAERGFYRRADIDASFLAPWSVVVERADLTPRVIVDRYEGLLAPLMAEAAEKRKALLDASRRLAELDGGVRVVEIDDDEILARHADLLARDNAVALEASVARLTRELETAKKRTRSLREKLGVRNEELREVYSSRTWRYGRVLSKVMRGGRG